MEAVKGVMLKPILEVGGTVILNVYGKEREVLYIYIYIYTYIYDLYNIPINHGKWHPFWLNVNI